MTTIQKTLIAAGTLVLAVCFGAWLNRHQPAKIALAHLETTHAKVGADSSRIVYLTTERTLTKTLTHFDTVRAEPQIDTMWVPHFIEACDSLRSVCGQMQSAANERARRDSIVIDRQSKELAVIAKEKSCTATAAKSSVLGAGVGYLIGKLTP